MYRMTIIHHVPDLDRWASVMHQIEAIAHPGLRSRRVYHSIDEPNEVMVVFDFDTAESATSYLPKLPREELRDELGLGEDFYPPVFIGALDEELSFHHDDG